MVVLVHKTVSSGNLKEMSSLILQHEDSTLLSQVLNARDEAGSTVLSRAASISHPNTSVAMCSLLLKSKADLSQQDADGFRC